MASSAVANSNFRTNNNNRNNNSNGYNSKSGATNEPTATSQQQQRRPSASSRPTSSKLANRTSTGGADSESVTTTSNAGANELMLACQADDFERVNTIIQRNGSSAVSARDNYGRTALHYATEVASVKSAEIILFHNPKLLHEQDIDGCTALHGAVIAGNLTSVRWLIQRGALPDAIDNEQHSVLHWATVSAHPEIVEFLLREIKTTPQPDLHHAYPLHYAAQMCGTESNSNNGNGNSANGNSNNNGHTTGAAGVISGSQGLTSQLALLTLLKLVECGHPLDVCDEDNRQPIIWAANNGAAEACYVLVNAGASVNAADKDGLTALHCAATRGQTRCVAALLRECGARHDAQDSNKCTPLFYAATFGHTACCRVLVENGANVNHVDRKNRTASHCAASKGFLECLKYLISVGTNIWQRSVKGDYPMSEAIANGHTGLVTQLLLSFNSEQRKALAKVRRGRTPLHSAAAANQLELCKVLLDHGSAVNAVHFASGQYYSPYDFAVIRGNVEVAEYIRARGAAPASKVIKHAARVIQKYYRNWHVKRQKAIEQQKQQQQQQVQRPKSLTNSERGIKLEPIVPAPSIVDRTPEQAPPPASLLQPVTEVIAAKKIRPTHQRTRKQPSSNEASASNKMADTSLLDTTAGFFDDEPAASNNNKQSDSRQSSAKQDLAHAIARSLSNTSNSTKPEQQLDASMNSASFNDAVFASMASEENANLKAKPAPVSAAPVVAESSLNYNEYPHGGGGVRIEITASSSRALQSPTFVNVPVETATPINEEPQEPPVVAMRSQTPPQPAKQPSPSRPFSGGQREMDNDDLERLIQQSTSGGETLSLRDEDDDGVESDDGAADLAAARRRVAEYHSKDKDSGTNNSSNSQKPLSADDSPPSPVVPQEAPQPPTQPYSRAQSSTKSVRIVETPTVLEPASVDVDDYDQYEHQPREDMGDKPRLWVDALGRTHQMPTSMKMARPLQRLRMKSSVVRVKSVSEQVHKNVNQYERQRLLIEELKRLKRLQISKRNGVDPQYLSRSFVAIARKNAMISSTGGIDDAEKLLYDELYRRRLTEYRYIPEYHVEPSNDYAVYQVHNHRSPPITTSTAAWQLSASEGGQGQDMRAASAPVYEATVIRRHYEAATRRINHDMMQRVEKAYVPQPHIQLLLEREEQMLSARSGTSLSSAVQLHHQGAPSANIVASPRVPPSFATTAASLAASPYGESIRPHTSPGKMQQGQQQQVMATSTTTVLSRGGFVKVRTTGNMAPPAAVSSQNRKVDNATPHPPSSTVSRHLQATPVTPVPQQKQPSQKPQQPQPQRAGSAHSPHMQPLLASLIDPKTGNKTVAADQPSTTNRPVSGSNVNLPEV